jgi:hypothetical protein
MDQKPSFEDVQTISVRLQMADSDLWFVRLVRIVLSVRLRMTASGPLFVRFLSFVLSVRLRITASDPLFVRFLPIYCLYVFE